MEDARRDIQQLIDVSSLEDLSFNEQEFLTVLEGQGYNVDSRSRTRTKDKHETQPLIFERPQESHLEKHESAIAALLAELGLVLESSSEIRAVSSDLVKVIIDVYLEGGRALLTQAQVGEQLGMTGQRAHQILRDEDAPPPVLTIPMDKELWLASDIAQWKRG